MIMKSFGRDISGGHGLVCDVAERLAGAGGDEQPAPGHLGGEATESGAEQGGFDAAPDRDASVTAQVSASHQQAPVNR